MDEDKRALAGDGIFEAVAVIRVLAELGLEEEEAKRVEAALVPLVAELQKLPAWD